MDGVGSTQYDKFSDLFYEGMKALRERVDELCLIL